MDGATVGSNSEPPRPGWGPGSRRSTERIDGWLGLTGSKLSIWVRPGCRFGNIVVRSTGSSCSTGVSSPASLSPKA